MVGGIYDTLLQTGFESTHHPSSDDGENCWEAPVGNSDRAWLIMQVGFKLGIWMVGQGKIGGGPKIVIYCFNLFAAVDLHNILYMISRNIVCNKYLYATLPLPFKFIMICMYMCFLSEKSRLWFSWAGSYYRTGSQCCVTQNVMTHRVCCQVLHLFSKCWIISNLSRPNKLTFNNSTEYWGVVDKVNTSYSFWSKL